MRARRRHVFRYGLILLALFGFGGYVVRDAIYGAHGLLARERLNTKISVLNKELNSLQDQRKRLEQDAQLLTSRVGEQPALLDAEARALLDFARPTDIVIVHESKSGP